MLLAANREAVRYGGTFLAVAGVYPGPPIEMVRQIYRFMRISNCLTSCGLRGLTQSFGRAGHQTIWHHIMSEQQVSELRLPLQTVRHLLQRFIYLTQDA